MGPVLVFDIYQAWPPSMKTIRWRNATRIYETFQESEKESQAQHSEQMGHRETESLPEKGGDHTQKTTERTKAFLSSEGSSFYLA